MISLLTPSVKRKARKEPSGCEYRRATAAKSGTRHVIRHPCFALEESDIPTGKYFPE
jgi:hypothetical protein